MELNELNEKLQDIFIDINRTRNMLWDGKVVQANAKLQGLQTKVGNLLNSLSEGENNVDAENPEASSE